jgi:hypothetical protein
MRSLLAAFAVAASLPACDGATIVPGGDAGVANRDAGRARIDAGSDPEPIDFFAYLADPYVVARDLPGQMRLASSRFPEGPDGGNNADFDNYVGRDGDELVMLDAEGPGVVTRLWFTMRDESDSQLVADSKIIHVYVDGEEVEWGDADRGIRLGELGSGEVPGFPRPWVAGRDIASGGIQSTVPLHYLESIRITMDREPVVQSYYQIDYRELPIGAFVRSFDGSPSEDEVRSLEEATRIWIDHDLRAAEHEETTRVMAAGSLLGLEVSEPSVLRRLAIEVLSGDAGALRGALEVDSEIAVDAPLASWMFGADPTEPHASALSVIGERSFELFHPIPVRSSAAWTITNESDAPVEVRLELDRDAIVPSDDLRQFRASCGAPATVPGALRIGLLDLDGVRGHYAGQSLVIRPSMWGWALLEVDHEVEVDGDFPIMGTGLEDYFGGSYYYLAGPFALPMTGATGRMKHPVTVVSQYRHHIIDTIPFEESFLFSYESAVMNSIFENCTYWYEE